jgi:hypothetical protein
VSLVCPDNGAEGMTLTAMQIAAMHTRFIARAVDASTIPVTVAFLPIVTYYVTRLAVLPH